MLPSPIDWTHPLSRGLLAYWAGLPGSVGGSRLIDWVDPGPNGNHGTLTNMDPATGWPTTAKGWALQFDGSDDYVELNAPAHLQPTAAISVAARVYLDSSHGDSYPKIIDWDNDSFGYQMSYDTDGGGQYIFATADGSAVTATSGVATKDRWIDLVGTFDARGNRTVKIYVDGDLKDTTDWGDVLYTGLTTLRIGTRGSDARHWKGMIEYLCVWDRALLLSEIQELAPDVMLRLRSQVYAAAVAAAAAGNPWYTYAQQAG
jgi:hypothetical protein